MNTYIYRIRLGRVVRSVVAIGCCVACLMMVSCKHGRQRHRALVFHNDIVLPTTPVKDQGSSSLCWVYAMLATIETEHLVQGDSVNLSADYVARAYIMEQAENRFLHGYPTKADNDISTRGVAPMLLSLIATHGLTHQDAYHHPDGANMDVLVRKVQQVVDGEQSEARMRQRVSALLDESLGPLPRQVFMLGARYTPLEFAHSVCADGEYVALTSFTHHPYYQRFALELPDNRYHCQFLNVPLDTLIARVEQSLRHGHPVCWEGDISERYFRWNEGYAVLHNDTATVTAAHRQRSFEHHLTTDDHCMEIIGLAHDDNNQRYFILKNSWGTSNRYGGYMYMSLSYARLKTIAIIGPQAPQGF